MGPCTKEYDGRRHHGALERVGLYAPVLQEPPCPSRPQEFYCPDYNRLMVQSCLERMAKWRLDMLTELKEDNSDMDVDLSEDSDDAPLPRVDLALEVAAPVPADDVAEDERWL